MQNRISDNGVREFRNPFRNYENVCLMMWAKAQDSWQKGTVNKTDRLQRSNSVPKWPKVIKVLTC